jgi:hypothetical protein
MEVKNIRAEPQGKILSIEELFIHTYIPFSIDNAYGDLD